VVRSAKSTSTPLSIASPGGLGQLDCGDPDPDNDRVGRDRRSVVDGY